MQNILFIKMNLATLHQSYLEIVMNKNNSNQQNEQYNKQKSVIKINISSRS